MRKYFRLFSLVLCCFVLIMFSGCSLFNKELGKEDALNLYAETIKNYYEEPKDGAEEEQLKIIIDFPVKKMEYVVLTNVKEKGTDNETNTTSKLTTIRSGDQSNLCFEVTSDDGTNVTKNYLYIKDDKYYMSEGSKTNNPEEIDLDTFYMSVAFCFIIYIFDMNLSSEDDNALIGTSELREGFKSATKGLFKTVYVAEVEYTTTTITLKKSLLKEYYLLEKYEKVEKLVEDPTTTTTTTKLTLTY